MREAADLLQAVGLRSVRAPGSESGITKKAGGMAGCDERQG
jgi:hypothetical protein